MKFIICASFEADISFDYHSLSRNSKLFTREEFHSFLPLNTVAIWYNGDTRSRYLGNVTNRDKIKKKC